MEPDPNTPNPSDGTPHQRVGEGPPVEPLLDTQGNPLAGEMGLNSERGEVDPYQQVKHDFIVNTRSIKDILNLPPEERPEVEITCVDERAIVSITDKDGNIDIIHINTPGGGTEFLEDEDIEHIIMKSNGTIRINSHKLCGWGEFVFDQILNGKQQDVVENGESGREKKLNGIMRVMASVMLAVDDSENVFFEKYKQELKELGVKGSLDFINRARQYVIAKSNKEQHSDPDHRLEALVLQAFAHGKTIKLATRFKNIHQKMLAEYEMLSLEEKEAAVKPPRVDEKLLVSTNIDTLEAAPHSHTAKNAVINMTGDRVITKRFQIDGEDAYFARVGTTKAFDLTQLLFNIMEGSHSETKEDLHTIHIFFDDEEIKAQMEAVLGRLLEEKQDFRKIVFHMIDEEDIEAASPLPRAN